MGKRDVDGQALRFVNAFMPTGPLEQVNNAVAIVKIGHLRLDFRDRLLGQLNRIPIRGEPDLKLSSGLHPPIHRQGNQLCPYGICVKQIDQSRAQLARDKSRVVSPLGPARSTEQVRQRDVSSRAHSGKLPEKHLITQAAQSHEQAAFKTRNGLFGESTIVAKIQRLPCRYYGRQQ